MVRRSCGERWIEVREVVEVVEVTAFYEAAALLGKRCVEVYRGARGY